jgi:GTP-binding protein
MFKIKNAKFLTSFAGGGEYPVFSDLEIAICGKSNVGKSTFINAFCNINNLAKTSKTAGKTRLINYFDVNNGELTLVDLAGYGYAEAPKEEIKKWGNLIEGYLKNPSKKHVFLLVDIRHKPNDNDKMLLNFLNYYIIPFTIIANKADKLSKQQIKNQVEAISSEFKVGTSDILAISAQKKAGLDKIYGRIGSIIDEHRERETDIDTET